MSEYEAQAEAFLKEADAEIKIRKTGVVEGFPFDRRDYLLHDRYSVTLSRNGKSYKFPFYGSAYDHEHGHRAKPYDILACLQSYPVEDDMWDFAEEFGYEIHCKEDYLRLEHCWKESRKQYKKLLELFGPELMEKLGEIS